MPSFHLQVHELWHLAPVCFDPDPEKRDLALLGVGQRYLAQNTDFGNTVWHAVFSQSIRCFQTSPKWRKLGQAMASKQQHPWPYRELDTAAISLWPILTRHNWTYRDLLNVVRSLIRTGQNHDRRILNRSTQGTENRQGFSLFPPFRLIPKPPFHHIIIRSHRYQFKAFLSQRVQGDIPAKHESENVSENGSPFQVSSRIKQRLQSIHSIAELVRGS